MLFFVQLALAAPVGAAELPTPPAPDTILVLPWKDVGFSPAAVDSPAFGPDLLALGGADDWALWDPVRHVVFGDAGGRRFEARMDRADALAFVGQGEVLVLDASARTVSAWRGDERSSTLALDRLCPADVQLVVDGDRVYGQDAFRNLHPVAEWRASGLAPLDGPRLVPPLHTVRVQAGGVEWDGAGVDAPANALAGRAVGDWLLLDAGVPGRLVERVLVQPSTGREVVVPLSGAYRPASGVAAGPDGSVGFVYAAADGVHLVRVRP